jgi:hypothetical protein
VPGEGVSGLEGGTVVGFKAGEEGIEHFPPRNDDDIEALAGLFRLKTSRARRFARLRSIAGPSLRVAATPRRATGPPFGTTNTVM